MANSSKDIQLIELKDMIAQLNTTIKTLTETMNRQQAENDNLKAELLGSVRSILVLPVNAAPSVLQVN